MPVGLRACAWLMTSEPKPMNTGFSSSRCRNSSSSRGGSKPFWGSSMKKNPAMSTSSVGQSLGLAAHSQTAGLDLT